VRGFAVGCLDGGGGGCGTSEDVVVSIDKERRGTKGDAIWRRDACKTVDNMMRVNMQEGMLLPAASTGMRIDHVWFHAPDERPGITDETV
jgi:hypothetical protein